MSTGELKQIADKATPEERLFLEHYLAHLRRSNDPANQEDLDLRMREMDEGKKVSWEEVKRRHEELEAKAA